MGVLTEVICGNPLKFFVTNDTGYCDQTYPPVHKGAVKAPPVPVTACP